MITLERWVQASVGWIEQSWNRLAEPDQSVALTGGVETTRAPVKSRWSLRAFSVALSQRGKILAQRMKQAFAPPEEQVGTPLRLYDRPGRIKTLSPPETSDAWSQPPDRQRAWRTPAFRVRLSPPGRVASGALSSLHAAPGELDRFVAEIRDERRAGLYPAQVFQQARELLRQSAPTG
ncbi:MAG: hypothetical protein HQL91_04715 [Magnetococcales bacterium]|nr:hypothetical protein [Magnetococcales bacterium]